LKFPVPDGRGSDRIVFRTNTEQQDLEGVGNPRPVHNLLRFPQARKMKYKLVVGCFFLWVLPALAQAPKDISKEYKEACDQLVCQCGCNEQLSVCAMQNCSSATPMRAEIRERLQSGESVEQIVDSFVARMGKKVLSAPTMKGFDITAWIMPFIILCLGLVVVGWIAVKMVRPGAAPAAAAAPVDPRIEKELRDFEEES
jgi:cytochrome c-type biogenesis protein CcmH